MGLCPLRAGEVVLHEQVKCVQQCAGSDEVVVSSEPVVDGLQLQEFSVRRLGKDCLRLVQEIYSGDEEGRSVHVYKRKIFNCKVIKN